MKTIRRSLLIAVIAACVSIPSFAQSACNPNIQSCVPIPCPQPSIDEAMLMATLGGLQYWYYNMTFEEAAYFLFFF